MILNRIILKQCKIEPIKYEIYKGNSINYAYAYIPYFLIKAFFRFQAIARVDDITKPCFHVS